MNTITLGFFLAKSKTTINGLLLLFALLLLNTQTSWGQTPVPMSSQGGLTYTENFADITNWTANFAAGIGASRWSSYPITAGGTANDGKRTTKSSTTFVTATAGGVQKGTGNLIFLSTGSGTTSEATAVDLLLDFSGVLAGTLSFNWAAVDNGSGTRPTSLRVYWSTDNTTFTELTAAQIIDIQSVNSGFITNVNLPVNFNNSATARLRFYNHAGTVVGSGNRDKISIDDLVITALAATSTTWNGSAWSYGAPTASLDAFIAEDYSAVASITAKTLTVNNNAVATIPSGNNVTVTGAVTVTAPATLTFSNNANLIQDPASTTNSNTGAITVNRNSNPLFRLDYTLWSSPVSGTQTLANFSPLTSQSPSRFYVYDYNRGTNGLYSSVAPTTAFTTGTGYLIRMPNEGSVNYNAGTETLAYPGIFTGTPNNGTVNLIGLTPNTYSAIGNPYPSTISTDAFITGNSIVEALYLWRKTNGIVGTAYATYTLAGGAGTGPGTSAITPNGTIQIGQGFIVKAPGTTIAFTNAMRTTNNVGQIMKTKVVERNRIWLNLTSPAGGFNQMMLAYMTGATQGIDAAIDGRSFNDSPTALNSFLNNEEFAIQGRALPFDGTDIVPLAFKTATAGNYTIAIDRVDGLFLDNQDIYLFDSKTGTETNLKTSSYLFTATVGVDNARFSLKFQKTLNVDVLAFNDKSVIVYRHNGVLYVNSGAKIMNNITVFDIQGRLVAERNNVKANATSIQNLIASNQVLIVKVTTDDNQVVSKKVEN